MKLKKLLILLFISAIAYFVIDVGRYFIYPNIAALREEKPGKTAFMEYREKIWQEKGIEKEIKNTWVPLSRISPYVVKAVIIAEDDKFWSHEGFDFEAMQQALEKDIKKKKFQAGGSTISQQLAKNLYLSPSKNPVRKIKEAIITWRLEKKLPKKRIIELYLNVAEMGDGVFGVEAAAQIHYRKHASGLSAREAATLASILPTPRRYKPNSSSRYVENRSERIYRIMLRRGIVIREYEEVINETEAEEEKVSEVPEAEGQIIDDQNVNDQKTDDQKREEKPEAEQTDVNTENNTK